MFSIPRLGNILAFPIYWYLHVWQDNSQDGRTQNS